MKISDVFFAVILLFGLSAAKDGEPLPAKSYQISCSFQEGLCGWMNEPTPNQPFAIASHKAKIASPPKGCNYLLLHGEKSAKSSQITAALNSPEFMTLQNMIAMQVNISYWIRNYNNTAKLQLILVPQDGTLNGSHIDIWSTAEGQMSSQLWNQTTLNIKRLRGPQKLKMIIRASVGTSDDLVAVNEITVSEISASEMPDIGSLSDVSFTLSNNTTCASGVDYVQANKIFIWMAILAILHFIV